MPFSFIDIEKEKSRKIVLLFIILVAFYFITAFSIVMAFRLFINFNYSRFSLDISYVSIFPSLKTLTIVFFIALISALAHWFCSTANLMPRFLDILGAFPLSSYDTYHTKFKNIVEEVSVATGGRKIEPYVVNSNALNAFAVADFKGRTIIGATEGLLIKLNRSQLEAVVGHEAAHIVSGDCLTSTISCSLFELHSATFNLLKKAISQSWRVGPLAFFMFLLLGVTKFMSKVIKMWISREKEYRADAVAVRLTRDPLSLAEALCLINTSWRGTSICTDELSTIFIINPKIDDLDEREDFIANLFSTHPPIKHRINILLDMAHSSISDIEHLAEENLRKSGKVIEKSEEEKWYVRKDDAWEGPFLSEKLPELKWLMPQTWIYGTIEKTVKHAADSPFINKIFLNRLEGKSSGFSCPICNVALTEDYYEGALMHRCEFCKGCFLKHLTLSRIIVREQKVFSSEISRLVKDMREVQKRGYRKYYPLEGYPSGYLCPICSDNMKRILYPGLYPLRLEIERCNNCALLWLDKDELEILQYIQEEGRDTMQIKMTIDKNLRN